MVLSYLNSMQLVYVMYADIHRMASQYDLPNHTNRQVLQVWKPWLINFKHYNSACKHYFQKPPDRIVHLSNLYNATRMDLAYGGVLCSAFTHLSEVLLCGHLLVQSRHCHAHAAIRSRDLCSLGFKLADKCSVGTQLVCLPF